MGDIIIGHHGFDNLDTISNATRALWLESAVFAALDGLALGQIQPDTEITVDTDNNAGAVAFRVMLQ